MLRLWRSSSLHVTNSLQPSSILNLSRAISLLLEVQFVFYLKENAWKREESPSTRMMYCYSVSQDYCTSLFEREAVIT